MAKKADNLVSSKVVGEWFGLTARRVQQLAKDGTIPFTRDNRGSYKFNLQECCIAYIKYLSDFAYARQEKSDAVMSKEESEARFKAAKAAMEEIKLEELKANMHRAEDVQECVGELIWATKGMLEALPGRVAMDCAGKTAAEISVIVEASAKEILVDLSQYEYDSEEYKRRVRERYGWRDADEEEDEES